MENKPEVVEKRIKPGIIRRRTKALPPEAAVSEVEAPPATANKIEAEGQLTTVESKKQAAPEEQAAAAPIIRSEGEVSAPGEAAPPLSQAKAASDTSSPSVAPKPLQETRSSVAGPRALPEGPPVGTIIQLPHMKKKADLGSGLVSPPKDSKTTAATPEEESEEKKKLRKAPKKAKSGEIEFDIEEISHIGTVVPLARLAPRTIADRVFQPARAAKKRRGGKSKREVKKQEVTLPKAIKRIVKMGDSIVVSDLAQQLGVKSSEIIKKLMQMGSMAAVNQAIDYDTASLLAQEYQWEVKKTTFEESRWLTTAADTPESLIRRAPVVTVMGHVDHGKTSLLDAIRSTQVALGEHGGITQHIGAYRVRLGEGRELTFLDTPGHEAFTLMRARGASITDIVILVVAADDGVMPQTIEAIHHAKAAEVPIIVAVNKIDKPDAQPEHIKRQLAEQGLVAEDWGGDTLFAYVSAKQKQGIEALLELIFLQAEMLDLKANPDKLAKGTVIEARLEKGRGPVATALVEEGTLRVGDLVVVGTCYGRVRAMIDDRGESLQSAGPGLPVEILGLDGVPQASEALQAIENEKVAKQIIEHRALKSREQRMSAQAKMSLEDLFAKLKAGEAKSLALIVKADVQGSVEAFQNALEKLSTSQVRVNILHTGVGGISESDVMLASASNCVIIGFQVRPDTKARSLAEQEGVEIKIYQVIYDAVEDVKKALEGLLAPTLKEKYLGRAEVREVFNISKVGNIAGCHVVDGKILRNANIRLLRDHVILYEGKLASLKRFKDDVREVEKGYDCGLGIEGYNDLKTGDVIECYQIESLKTKL